MRHFIEDNALVFQRLRDIDLKLLAHDNEIEQLFKQLEQPRQDKAVIFFKGQMWDATSCIEDIIGRARKTIILIDGYVDKNTLDMLISKRPEVSVIIHTNQKSCKVTDKEYSDKWNEIAAECIRRIREIAGDIKILIGGYLIQWNHFPAREADKHARAWSSLNARAEGVYFDPVQPEAKSDMTADSPVSEEAEAEPELSVSEISRPEGVSTAASIPARSLAEIV